MRKIPVGGCLSVKCVEERCLTPNITRHQKAVGCGTSEVGQALDGDRLAPNEDGTQMLVHMFLNKVVSLKVIAM